MGDVLTATDRWWPSPFGEDDQIGMLNHITDAKRADALSWVRHGRIYDLGHVLDEHVPVFPGRAFHQTLVTSAHHANRGGVGDNHVNWITEVVSGTTQLGTHVDALSHLQIGDRGYNGWTVSELAEPWGVNRLGAETIPQIVTKGWLVDVAAKRLEPGGVIAVADIERARRRTARARGRSPLPHRLERALERRADVPLRRARPRLRGGRLARRARHRAHRLRHLELRAGPSREPSAAVRSPAASERAPRRLHRREPRHRRTRGRRYPRVRPDPDPRQASRRHRRLDLTHRTRLTEGTP